MATLAAWRVVAFALACVGSTGCAATRGTPDASLRVVRAYIESGRFIRHRCDLSEEMAEVVDCFPSFNSVATFVVEDLLAGRRVARRLRIQFHYRGDWPELRIGRSHQYVVAFTTDGMSTDLEEIVPVAAVSGGGWAIPIRFHQERQLFPCSAYDPDPERLQFVSPRPRQAVADIGVPERFLGSRVEADDFTLESGYLYSHKGIRLEHAPAAYGDPPAGCP